MATAPVMAGGVEVNGCGPGLLCSQENGAKWLDRLVLDWSPELDEARTNHGMVTRSCGLAMVGARWGLPIPHNAVDGQEPRATVGRFTVSRAP